MNNVRNHMLQLNLSNCLYALYHNIKAGLIFIHVKANLNSNDSIFLFNIKIFEDKEDIGTYFAHYLQPTLICQ